jgi:hypothetical protein
VIYKYRNISSDVDSYIVGDKWYGCYVTWVLEAVNPFAAPTQPIPSNYKNIYERHIVHKAVWGDLATAGRVRIFTTLNKNNGYERVTEHPERS